MHSIFRNKERGFIALIVVVITAAILLLVILQNSAIVVALFDEARLKQDRLLAIQNALTCLDRADLELTHDYFFAVSSSTGPTGVSYQFLQCSIVSVTETNGGILGDGHETVIVAGKSSQVSVAIVAQILLEDRKISLLSEKTLI